MTKISLLTYVWVLVFMAASALKGQSYLPNYFSQELMAGNEVRAVDVYYTQTNSNSSGKGKKILLARDRSHRFEFNADGHKVKTEFYDHSEGKEKIKNWVVFTYDSDGNPQSQSHYYLSQASDSAGGNMAMINHERYTYENGKKASSASYFEFDGTEELLQTSTYEYDAKGRLTLEKIHYLKSIWAKERRVELRKEYGKDGTERTILIDSTSKVKQEEVNFDGEGRVLKYTAYGGEFINGRYEASFNYGPSGRIDSEKYYYEADNLGDPDFPVLQKNFYDEKGKLIRQELEKMKGGLEQVFFEYTYFSDPE